MRNFNTYIGTVGGSRAKRDDNMYHLTIKKHNFMYLTFNDVCRHTVRRMAQHHNCEKQTEWGEIQHKKLTEVSQKEEELMMSLGCGLDTKSLTQRRNIWRHPVFWDQVSTMLTHVLPPPGALQIRERRRSCPRHCTSVPQGGDNHLHCYLSLFMFDI